jgi:tetratricopeptide (TPR) repeat protein
MADFENRDGESTRREPNESEQHRRIADEITARWQPAVEEGTTPIATLKLPRSPAESKTERSFSVPQRRIGKQSGDGADAPDYLVISELGRGGMGVVHRARQTSLDREVALKQYLADDASETSRQQFMVEAAVIGELDHPNIVPIHDLGENQDGRLFYSMKRIRGVPWNRALPEYGLERNLDVFLKVCDAVAFAHARKVIHRDIKPHNVMLGDFGEVFLVDWGLSARVGGETTPEGLSVESALGGTASYMPPEMARGEIDRISFASDVYLLGAILFEILTGSPPHQGETVMDCLQAAAANEIVPHDEGGELMRIALRAMSEDPDARYPTVKKMQEVVREYLAHRESLTLSAEARAWLDEAIRESDYAAFQRAVFGFEKAGALWPDNEEAAEGAAEASRAYAHAAVDREDLDLAASLLPAGDPLGHEIELLKSRRDSRRSRIRILTHTARALAAAVVLVLAVGLVLISRERNRVLEAEAVASSQRDLALETLDTLVYEVDRQLEHRPAMHGLREALLSQSIDGLNQIVASMPEGAEVDQRLATAHESIARIYHASRRNDEALAHQQKVLSIREQGQLEGDPAASKELAAAHMQMGEILHNYRMGDLRAARDQYLRALELLGEGPGADEDSLTYVQLYQALGDVNFDLQNIDQAARWYGRSTAASEALLARRPADAEVGRALVNALSREGDVAFERGSYALSGELYQRSYELGRDLLEAAPSDQALQRATALALFSIADARAAEGNVEQAREDYLRAQDWFEDLVEADATNGQLQRDLLVVLWTRGRLEEGPGNVLEAREHYLAALEIADRLWRLNPANAEARRDLMLCCHRLGGTELALGRTETAREHYLRALSLAEELADERPDNLFARTDLVVAYSKLADLAFEGGDQQTARGQWQAALAILLDLRTEGRITSGSRFYPWIEQLEASIAACD